MLDRNSNGDKPNALPDDNELAESLRKRMERAGRQVLGDKSLTEGRQFAFRSVHDDHRESELARISSVLLTSEATSNQETESSSSLESVVLRESPDPAINVGGYQSPMLLAQMLVVMLALQAGYFIASLLTHFSVLGSGLISTSHWDPVEMILFPVTAAAFVAWIYRLYRNLGHFGSIGLSTTPFMASALVAAPIINLVTPPIILHDVWGATNPHVDCRVDASWRKTSFDAIIPIWWFTFVAAIGLRVGANFAPSLAGNPLMPTAVCLAFTASAVLGIVSIWRVSVRQDDKQLLLRAGLQEA